MNASYLPAGSRVVVQNEKGVRYHTTVKELEVPANPQGCNCPLTHKFVRFIDQDGFRVMFKEDQVKTRVDESVAANLEPYLMYYLIPERSGIENPSHVLHNFAFRVDGSVWVVPKANIPYALIHEMTERGAVVNCVKFDASEGKNLAQQAVSALQKEVAAAVRRAERSRQDSEMELNALQQNPGIDASEITRIEKLHLKRAESVQRRNAELFKALTNAAKTFGIAPEVLNLAAATSTVDAISTGMSTRAKLFVEAVNTLRAMNTGDSNALAASMEQGQVAPEIVADFLDDNDHGTGEALRSAFTVEVLPDETYSLTDVDDAA